jgi:hypothetical protein
LTSGVVVFLGGAEKFDCTICDISGNGGRIVAPRNADVPKHFFLIDVRSRVVYVAMVIWRRGAEVGLLFAMDLPLAKLSDPALLFLKRAWLERAVR